MVVGIVGIGLIGGSFAKCYHEAGHTVYAHDIDKKMLDYSILAGVVDKKLTENNVSECDLIILAVYTEDIIEYTRQYASKVNKNVIVIDCSGVKTRICEECFRIADEHSFTFVGAHPMAGSHLSFFKHSDSNMFKGAHMVLVPPNFESIEVLAKTQRLLEPAGFKHYSITTAKDHDEKIAYTSQMAHVIASSYVKNPQALKHEGYSADSFKEMTRVAWINSELWAGLLVENRDNVTREIDYLISNLTEYKAAIEAGDTDKLTDLLDEGTRYKEQANI